MIETFLSDVMHLPLSTDHLIRNSVSVPIPQDGKHTWDDYSHTHIANETLKFIEHNKDRPFFCYAAWTPPHGDYVNVPAVTLEALLDDEA